jgi:pSer/pThr/pTyr-binding forkhead associated (FHA) protein
MGLKDQMVGEFTSKIKLQQRPISIKELLHCPRLIRKKLEVPLLLHRGPLLIGRDERLATLIIDDRYISRTHAAIFLEGEKYFVQDLNSKNGTFLNGEKIPQGQRSPRPLKNGDHIKFHRVEFEFVTE